MTDTTVKKVEAGSSPSGEMGQKYLVSGKRVSMRLSPSGEMGQKYLVSGKRVSMRLWIDEPGGKLKTPTTRDYETVGYVISGSAKLDLEGQTLNLKTGDSWLVPAGATHQYTIIERFTAIEATAPPAEVHGRDAPDCTLIRHPIVKTDLHWSCHHRAIRSVVAPGRGSYFDGHHRPRR